MPVELYMPKMSDHMEKGRILKWLVEEGVQVEQGEPVLEVETDKVVAEVEAPASGILRGVRAQADAEILVGEVIAFIARPGEDVPRLPPLAGQVPTTANSPAAPKRGEPARRALASPAARRLAKEHGLDLTTVPGTGPGGRVTVGDVQGALRSGQVTVQETSSGDRVACSPVARKLAQERDIDLRRISGTGPGGRITKEDVLAHAEARATSPELVLATQSSFQEDVDWLDLSPARRVTGERLSWQNIPHFTLTVVADMREAVRLRGLLQEKIRAETGHGLSYTAVLVRVVAVALRSHPLANAEFCNGRIKVHRQINVGVATNTDDGLLVPVVHAADSLGLAEIARQLGIIREKAAARGFAVADLSGGTFTISNLGMHGIDRFSAIINPPQSAILAVGRILNSHHARPAGRITDENSGSNQGSRITDHALNGPLLSEVEVGSRMAPTMNLTLSVDHRVLDGAAGAAFLSRVKELLENPYQLL